MEGVGYSEFPGGEVGFPTGDSPEEFLANRCLEPGRPLFEEGHHGRRYREGGAQGRCRPLDGDVARATSSYHGWCDGELVRLLEWEREQQVGDPKIRLAISCQTPCCIENRRRAGVSVVGCMVRQLQEANSIKLEADGDRGHHRRGPKGPSAAEQRVQYDGRVDG